MCADHLSTKHCATAETVSDSLKNGTVHFYLLRTPFWKGSIPRVFVWPSSTYQGGARLHHIRGECRQESRQWYTRKSCRLLASVHPRGDRLHRWLRVVSFTTKFISPFMFCSCFCAFHYFFISPFFSYCWFGD